MFGTSPEFPFSSSTSHLICSTVLARPNFADLCLVNNCCSSILNMVPHSLTAVFQGGYLLVQREIIGRSANDTGPHTTLQAAPFNRLGVWAYIAFGFIVLAVSTVISYMVYTCCYSARQRQYYGNNTRAARRIGAVKIHSIDQHSSISRTQGYQLDKAWDRALSGIARVDKTKENAKLNGSNNDLEPSESSVSATLTFPCVWSTYSE